VQRGEHRGHDSFGVLICAVSLVVLEKLFEQRSGRILMTDDVVKRLNNAFVVFSEPVRVGVCCSHPERVEVFNSHACIPVTAETEGGERG
jgi:hypothetical protein